MRLLRTKKKVDETPETMTNALSTVEQKPSTGGVNKTKEQLDWKEPPKIDIDFSPPTDLIPPSSPRPPETRIFEAFESLHQSKMASAKANGKRPASGLNGSSPPPQPHKRPLVTRPTCTHISMVKLYFDKSRPLQCYQCGRVPSIGFIYACEQDRTHPPDQKASTSLTSSSNGNKQQRKLLKSKRRPSNETVDTGSLSKWMLDAINEGHYTQEQIDKLVAQKAHLQLIISQSQAIPDELMPKDSPSKILTQMLAQVDLSEKSQEKPKGSKTRQRSISKSVAQCEYRVCHTCRPNSREKAFVSFESVFNNEVELPSTWHEPSMPVAKAHVVGNLGLRPPPQYPIPKAVQSESIDSQLSPHLISPRGTQPGRPATWSAPTRVRPSASGEGLATSLRKSLFDMLRMRLGSPSPASAPPTVDTSPTANDSAYSSTESRSSVSKAEVASSAAVMPTEEQNASITSQINALSDLCTTDTGEFDVGKWRQLSDEVLAKAAALDLTATNGSVREQDLARVAEAAEEGEMSIVDKAKLAEWQEEREAKLNALKEGDVDAKGETGLELGHAGFGGLGLRLTEEAAENNSPDVIMSA